MTTCIMPGRHTPGYKRDFSRRGMCVRHYDAWYYAGKPAVFLGVEVPESLQNPSAELPNPWIKVAPSCPTCGISEWVFLWAGEGDLRWFCQPCRRRFDSEAA